MSERNLNEKTISPIIPIIAGGTSGVVTRFLTQPLDVIKIRFQLQVEPINTKSLESKYVSIPQAMRVILREEGLFAFWKGHVPAQALSVVYGVIQFGLYDRLIREANLIRSLAENKGTVEFISGFTAGCVATLASFPFDIVRTRLIAQGNQKIYSTTLSALRQILHTEGFRGWYKGLTPTLIQMGPAAGLNFALFNFFKRLFLDILWLKEVKTGSLTMSGSMLAGSLTGFTCKIITYPLDLSRKRMQLQGFQKGRVGFGQNFSCTSLRTCISHTVRKEHAFGLFKGLVPSLVKSSVVTSLVFTIYERTHSLLSNINTQDIV